VYSDPIDYDHRIPKKYKLFIRKLLRIALGMTITPHLWAVILGGNPEDIGLSCDHRGADQEEKGYNKSKSQSSHRP
jgi:hypothetical protein